MSIDKYYSKLQTNSEKKEIIFDLNSSDSVILENELIANNIEYEKVESYDIKNLVKFILLKEDYNKILPFLRDLKSDKYRPYVNKTRIFIIIGLIFVISILVFVICFLFEHFYIRELNKILDSSKNSFEKHKEIAGWTIGYFLFTLPLMCGIYGLIKKDLLRFIRRK